MIFFILILFKLHSLLYYLQARALSFPELIIIHMEFVQGFRETIL